HVLSVIFHLAADGWLQGSSRGPLVFLKCHALPAGQIMILRPEAKTRLSCLGCYVKLRFAPLSSN
ncbi:Uncharacterized protein DAT39_004998, partial [Clarias magur]